MQVYNHVASSREGNVTGMSASSEWKQLDNHRSCSVIKQDDTSIEVNVFRVGEKWFWLLNCEGHYHRWSENQFDREHDAKGSAKQQARLWLMLRKADKTHGNN